MICRKITCNNIVLATLVVAKIFFRLQTFMCSVGLFFLAFLSLGTATHSVQMSAFLGGCLFVIVASSHAAAGSIANGHPLPMPQRVLLGFAYAMAHLLPAVEYARTPFDGWGFFAFSGYYFAYPCMGLGVGIPYWVMLALGAVGCLFMAFAAWQLHLLPKVQLVIVGPSFVPVLFRWLAGRAVAAVTFFTAREVALPPGAAGNLAAVKAKGTTPALKGHMAPFAPRLRVYAWLWAVVLMLWSIGNIMLCVSLGITESRLAELLARHWAQLLALLAQAIVAALCMRSMTAPYTFSTVEIRWRALLLLCVSLVVCERLLNPPPIPLKLYYDPFSSALALQISIMASMLFYYGAFLLPFVGPALLMLAHGSSMTVGDAAQGDKT